MTVRFGARRPWWAPWRRQGPGTAVSAAPPAGMGEGDLLVISTFATDEDAEKLTPPPGWTQVRPGQFVKQTAVRSDGETYTAPKVRTHLYWPAEDYERGYRDGEANRSSDFQHALTEHGLWDPDIDGDVTPESLLTWITQGKQ